MSAWPSWVKVGNKCVCINSAGWVKGRSLSWGKWLVGLVFGWPLKGGTYTITAIGYGVETDEPVIQLRGWSVWFQVENFRPLVDETALQKDVAYFKDLINQPVRESEPA